MKRITVKKELNISVRDIIADVLDTVDSNGTLMNYAKIFVESAAAKANFPLIEEELEDISSDIVDELTRIVNDGIFREN